MKPFLDQLEIVATHEFAFIAYLLLVVLWAFVGLKAMRFKGISQNLALVPEGERKSLLEKEYGFHLKEGMSAEHFLTAQRTKYVFLGLMGLLVALVLLAVLTIVSREKADPRLKTFSSSVTQIVAAIQDDFESIKGPISAGDTDSEREIYESKVNLPESTYSYIEFPKDDVPAFLSSLYRGTHLPTAYRVYTDFVRDFRGVTDNWQDQVGVIQESPADDYATFVKNGNKVVVSLDREAEDQNNVHVFVMFAKVTRDAIKETLTAPHPELPLAQGDSNHQPTIEIKNGDLLVLSGHGLAVAQLLHESDCKASYRWRYKEEPGAPESKGGGDLFERNDGGFRAGQITLQAGPYQVPWSCGTLSSGWVYPSPPVQAQVVPDKGLDDYRM